MPWLMLVACLLLEVMCVYGEHGVKVHRGLSLCLSTRSTPPPPLAISPPPIRETLSSMFF